MAEQAQKEPTMEEILSSIRKIIADDEPVAKAEPTEAVSPEVTDNGFDDLDLDFDDFDEEPAGGEDDILEALTETEDDSDVFEATDPEVPAESVIEAEDAFETFEPLEDAFVDDEPFEDLPELEDDTEDFVETAVEAVVETEEPKPMAAAAISDPSTVGAAAGALSKLLAKVEFGDDGDNSMEALVRELLRPMMKDWLDANLPGIVEKQVEAEVKRIARIAG